MVRLGAMQTPNLLLDVRQRDAQPRLNQAGYSGSLAPVRSLGVAPAGQLREGGAQAGGW